MKITRKITATIVAVAMAVSTMAFAQTDDKGLTDAVVAVKSIIEIGEKYENFSYSSYETDGETCWNLDWNCDDGYVGATVVNNVVTDMYINSYNEKQANIATLDLDDAKIKANEFLKKAMPGEYSLMKICDDSEIIKSSGSYEYSIYYTMHVNDIPVQNHTSRVGINKTSGEVSAYSRGFYDKTPVKFESAQDVVSIDNALDKFLENIGFKLKYNLYRDYKEKTVIAKPVYEINDFGVSVIDAKTGEVYKIPVDDGYRQYGGGGGSDSLNASKDMATEESAVQLSPQELEAVENVKGLLSKENAAEKIKNQIPGEAAENLEIRYANLNKNYYNDDFVWSMSFEVGGEYFMSASVDAKTGKLISFSKSTKQNNTYKKLTKDEAKTIAEEYIKTVRPDEFGLCEYSDEPVYDVLPIKLSDSAEKEVLEDYYHFTYVRKINGLKCEGNSISVSFDNTCGEINSFNMQWDSDVDFPSVDYVKTVEEIAAAAKEKCGFMLTYLTDGKLVYMFKTSDVFDAFTAETLDYNGEAKTEEYIPVMYDDISGHWCEEIIVKLYENGIYKKSPSFKPDEFITQREVFMMIAPTYRRQSDELLYEWAIDNGFITEEEKNPDGTLSRKLAAKFFVILMNYDEVAEKYEIFNYPFNDECADEFKGYVALCKAFGIVNGNESGKFCPENNVTNAEFASMMYKYKIK